MTAPEILLPQEAKAALARHQVAQPRRSLWQIAETLPPLLALQTLMFLLQPRIGWWVVLAAPLAAGLVVRAFALQHDCGHGSFFASRRANDALGFLCSLFTWTPYAHWRRQHAQHHAAWNDLDRRDRGVDIYSTCTTVAEYAALTPWQRFGHRLLRHPVVSLLLLPPVIFIGLYRFAFDTPVAWRRERRSVLLTNLALLAVYGGIGWFGGFGRLAMVQVPIMLGASIFGVWMFSVQHRFGEVVWLAHGEWTPVAAALRGTSFLTLPRVLRWFTADLGYHHLHHLAPRIPNYRLAECQGAHPVFAAAPKLSLWRALGAWRYALWDEAAGAMVRYPRRRAA